MISKCPIINIGIRNPVMCSDGYIYEERCLVDWLKLNTTSPVNRQLIEFVIVCQITEKSLNEYSDELKNIRNELILYIQKKILLLNII